MDTHSRIQEFANNSEIEKSQNKSHAKISEFTVAKMFKNLLLQNQKAYDFETWYEASGNGALQSLYKS